jgi:hypothetical protein
MFAPLPSSCPERYQVFEGAAIKHMATLGGLPVPLFGGVPRKGLLGNLELPVSKILGNSEAQRAKQRGRVHHGVPTCPIDWGKLWEKPLDLAISKIGGVGSPRRLSNILFR